MIRKKLYLAVLLCCLFLTSCNEVNIIKNDWTENKVYKWEDYFNSNESPSDEDFYLNLRLSEFPDITFEWTTFSITAKENEKVLISGMPVMSAYFTDLNDDGYPELCSTVYSGSGIVDMHIEIYDIKNDKKYGYIDRMKYDYKLTMENDILFVEKRPYMSLECERLTLDSNDLKTFEEDKKNIPH